MENSSESLRKIFDQRLQEVEKFPKIDEDNSILNLFEENSISRRDFMKWVGVMTAYLGLASTFIPTVAKAVELADRLPIIWLHMAECTGCTESLLRSGEPTIDTLIFDHISLEYHETLMSASGWQAEQNLENAIEKYKDQYVLMVEGAIPQKMEGEYLTIGGEGKTGHEMALMGVKDAATIFSIGTCSSFGGVQAAFPNPTGAVALSDITDRPVINVPGCPPSDKNIVGTLICFILYGDLPEIDAYNRPKWAYGRRVHSLCERRKHFNAGRFVHEFGDEGAKKGYCLFKVGCKGPRTFNNCPIERFNQGTSWPVQAGHGCIGCSEPDFWDAMKPFEDQLSGRRLGSKHTSEEC